MGYLVRLFLQATDQSHNATRQICIWQRTSTDLKTMQPHVGQSLQTLQPMLGPCLYTKTTSYVFKDCASASARFELKEEGNIYGRLSNPHTRSIGKTHIGSLKMGNPPSVWRPGCGSHNIYNIEYSHIRKPYSCSEHHIWWHLQP